MKKILSAVLALGLSAAALIGVPAQAVGKTLTLGVISGISDWQASSSLMANSGPFYQAVYSTLLYQKADGKTLTPGLATAWKYDKTNTLLTLTLRKGVTFTNGEAFNAAAVVQNVQAYQKGAAADASIKTAMIDTVTAKGTDTVIFKLKFVSSTLLTYLAHTLGFMQAPSTIGTAEAKATPVGCGPFILNKTKTVAGATYVFDPNPTYWDKAHRNYDNLVIKVIANATAAANAMKAGDVDAIPITDATAIDSLKAAGVTVGTQALNWTGITFVDKSGRMGSPFKYLKVRQAINYGFDRTAALAVLNNNYGYITQQIFAKYNTGYDAALDNTYKYDLAKAKALLAEAGYPNGFAVTMPNFAATPASQSAFIADQFGKMGITVTYVNHATIPDFFSAMQAPKYALYNMTLGRDSNEVVNLDRNIDRDAPWNPSGYGDATSDKLIKTMRTNAAGSKAYVAAAKALNKYMVQQAWNVPLIAPLVLFAYNPAKVNVAIHVGNSMPYLGDISVK